MFKDHSYIFPLHLTLLEVRVSNKIAIKLYLNLGYKIVVVLKSYYIDGEDAYIMVKAL